LLLAVLATPWLQPNAPPLVRELVGLLAVLTIMRVLSREHDADLRRVIAVAIPVWLLERTAIFLPTDSALGRVMLLVSSGLGFVILLSMSRRESVARLAIGRGWRALFTVLSLIGALGFGVAVCANLVGAVSLARGMTSWLLTSSVIALILYVGLRLLRGLLEALLALPPLGDLAIVRRRPAWIEGRLAAFFAVAFFVFWVWQGLVRAGADAAVIGWLRGVLAYPLSIGTLSITPGDVVAFILVLWLTIVLSRVLGATLEEEVLPRMALPRGVPSAISSGSRYVFLGIGTLLAISAAGIELGRLGLVIGALGVGIGFGLQNVVNNFVSGVILLFERPVQTGDTIEVGAVIGEVRRIGIRSSTIRTWEGAEVIVPNEKLVSAELVNWTLSDRHRRIELEVGVAYGTDPSRVVALLEGAALASAATLPEPPPHATLVAFGDSALQFRLRFWTSDLAEQFRARGEVAMGVHRALAEAGIEIPFPQRVVHSQLPLGAVERDPG
jgi:small-conductance mechanosensitive channel